MAIRKKKIAKKTKVIKTDTNKKRRGAGPGRGHHFKPTDDQRLQVKMLVGFGIEYKKIAALTINPKTSKGVSVNTLQKHFRAELDEGATFIESKLAGSLFRRAVSHDHPQGAVSAMFMLKCRFGYRQEDKLVHEVEGGTGVLIAPATLTPEEWIAKAQKNNEGKKSPADE